jgi:hypothetical protein
MELACLGHEHRVMLSILSQLTLTAPLIAELGSKPPPDGTDATPKHSRSANAEYNNLCESFRLMKCRRDLIQPGDRPQGPPPSEINGHANRQRDHHDDRPIREFVKQGPLGGLLIR